MDTEQSIIYRVSKDDYESCTLSPAARELGRCTAPMRQDKVKVSFRLLSPNPSALDYRPGQSYYFISTSTGTPWGLDNTRGGLCSTSQLKMIIHVGAYGHHHRHHRKPVTTTTTAETPSEEESDWPADPLWTQFFDKKKQQSMQILYYILSHMISVESLFSSSTCYLSSSLAGVVLLLVLLWT
ncbi:Ephrin [Teladorsagia circumcincta]|uniref:Ephrin n=1 Tax=Teladorsagia circumcincta TaxID=45464 RepID=A0A2G9V6E1_TELCI|nr:Ephrin [Teladorsagia circumcincta]